MAQNPNPVSTNEDMTQRDREKVIKAINDTRESSEEGGPIYSWQFAESLAYILDSAFHPKSNTKGSDPGPYVTAFRAYLPKREREPEEEDPEE